MMMIHPLRDIENNTPLIQRIRQMEEHNRWMMESLEWMVSLGDVLVGFSPEQGPVKILSTARLYLKRLIPFQTVSFLTTQEDDFDFTISFCEPETDQPLLQKELEVQIEEGHFAWALQQNRSLIVTPRYFDLPLVLHPLLTRSNVVGIFAGILQKEKATLSDVESNLLTLVLFNAAQGLENAMLYHKIHEQNRTLEETVQKRTEELRHALELAREASITKGMFLANMSHEIRTPLNAVIGFTEMLLETKLEEEQFDYVRTVRSSGETLLSLINDILDFSKMDAGQLHLEKIDFDPERAVYEVCKMVVPKVSRKPVEVLCRFGDRLPVSVKGDEHRFRQVLLNLAGNAAKFTESGEIEITIDQDKEEGNRVRLHAMVRDTGIGIPKDKLSVIFELFQQADGSTTRRYGGTGLGLSICKQISGAMGGEVWAESEPGKGSLFHFTAWFEKSENGQVKRFVPPSFSSRRILLFDRHQARMNLMQSILESAGVHVATFTEEEEVLSALKRSLDEGTSFDLCFIDIQTPSGYEIGKRVRQIGMEEVLLLSLSPPLERNAQKFREAGFNGFLNRPIGREKLFQLLKRHFGEEREGEKGDGRVQIGNEKDRSPSEEIKHPPRILVAEDHPVNQKMMVKMLEKLGCRVDTVVNGIEAIHQLERYTYDLVLMDCQMPEMDGYTATAEIRKQNGSGRHIPIIAVTANAMPEDRERCLKAGMNDYLSKPVQKEAVSEMIRKWIRH